jgi:HTH-type transcriptional regulator, competence development regulator
VSSPLGLFLRSAREAKKLSLREVERAAGVSNAYLSQLESGRIREPSPNVLHKLTTLYEVDYLQMMELAGYAPPKPGGRRRAPNTLSRLGPVSDDEADQLAEYLAFIRRRR